MSKYSFTIVQFNDFPSNNPHLTLFERTKISKDSRPLTHFGIHHKIYNRMTSKHRHRAANPRFEIAKRSNRYKHPTAD